MRCYVGFSLRQREGFDDADVPERSVAIGPEAMQCVRRYNNDDPGFRDDVHSVDYVDAWSLVHDEHLTLRMAMLWRANARGVAAQPDDSRHRTRSFKRHSPSVLVDVGGIVAMREAGLQNTCRRGMLARRTRA
jgi:hypothetical protein